MSTIIITAKYDNDPRPRRLVITPKIAAPVIEVCETDALGQPAWRVEKNAPDAVSVASLLRRGLERYVRHGQTTAGDVNVTIDLGKVCP